MKHKLLIALLVVGALAVGVGGAFAVYKLAPVRDEVKLVLPQLSEPKLLIPNGPMGRWNGDDFKGNLLDERGFGMMPGLRGDERRGRVFEGNPLDERGFGMMPGLRGDERGGQTFGENPFDGRVPGMERGRQGGRIVIQQGDRITVDKAIENVKTYLAASGDNLAAVEIMEFSNNFYAVVKETDTQKAAYELLVNPFTGQVTPEIGPNMMWNLKYRHMVGSADAKATNTVTIAEAVVKAQTALDARTSGAVVAADGLDFYGYYSFDYTVDGKVAGMLSVNGETGQVWFHTWHGTFISEQEIK